MFHNLHTEIQYTYSISIFYRATNRDNTLTPTSRLLQLQECAGCHLNNDVIGHQRKNAAHFLDQFPCRISCSHDEVLKLTITPNTAFDRDITLTFNTSMARLTADIRTSFDLLADPTSIVPN